MIRLHAPNGATVTVADEKAERLLALGYSPTDTKKAPAKKAAAKPAPAKKAPAKKARTRALKK